jgi:hypothetical protein
MKCVLQVHISQDPGHWAVKFFMVATYVFNIIIAVFFRNIQNSVLVHVHQVVDNSEVHKLLQNFQSLIWNLLYVIHLAVRSWRCIIDFWNVCGHAVYVACTVSYTAVFLISDCLRGTVLMAKYMCLCAKFHTILRYQLKVVVSVMAWPTLLLDPTWYIRMDHTFLN